jgi:hypothetical protein
MNGHMCVDPRSKKLYDPVFGFEKLCLVFFSISKWNVIFVYGYGRGKKSILKQSVIIIFKYDW